MTIAEVSKKYVKLFRQGRKTVKERRLLLEEQRNRLLKKQKDINETLERLNKKTEWYEEIEKDDTEDFIETP